MGILDAPIVPKDKEGTRLDAISVAPKIKVSSMTPGPALNNAPSGRALVGLFNSGQTAFWISSFGLSQSDNATASSPSITSKTLPSDAGQSAAAIGAAWMVLFKGYYYLQGKNTSGVPAIWRAAPVAAGTAFSWSAALFQSQAASGANCISTALSADANYLYWADYGDPLNGSSAVAPNVYRSADGITWETVLTGSFCARHVHGVFPDPYVPGDVYMTCGDVGSAGYVYVSHNYGASGSWASVPNIGTNQGWQCVELSFSAGYIYAAADVGAASFNAWRMDRATLTPRWIGRTNHRHMVVPGGGPSRQIVDLVTTAASTTITSATAAFTSNDVGSRVRTKGIAYVPSVCYIKSVTNSTTAVLVQAATFSGSGIGAVIGGETWGVGSYYGAVDPATGIYYFCSINGSFGGNVDGLFAIYPDGTLILLDIVNTSPDDKMLIDSASGYLWIHGFSRPLLSLAA